LADDKGMNGAAVVLEDEKGNEIAGLAVGDRA
jgi:hypothetical protein